MRLFAAIELPMPVRAHLVSLREQLGSAVEFGGAISWVKPENLHVTLKFLGAVPDVSVGEIVQALECIPFENALSLAADHMVFFPTRGPVRVIAVGLRGDVDQLVRIHQQVDRACAALGHAPESRAYTPHATLGRARITRRGGGVAGVRNADLADAFPGPTFSVESFVLMSSDLKPGGAVYTPVARFPLTSA